MGKKIDGASMLQTAIYNIVYVNDLACACVIDMEDDVKHQDKETQKIYRALLKRQCRYEEKLAEILGEYIGFCADYNSEMDDRVKDSVLNLYDCILRYLQTMNAGNCMFIAKAELAYTVIAYSVLSIEKRIEECRKYNKDVVNLRAYKLTEMETISKNLCNWASRKCDSMNLNDSEEITEAYRRLDKTLTDCSIIEKCLRTAKEENGLS